MDHDRTTICGAVRSTIAAAAIAIVASSSASSAQQKPDEREKASARIVALDPRWTVLLASAPSAPAGYDQEMAYVPLKDGELVAIDLDRGEVMWKVELETVSTPATGDGLVFAASDGAIHALEQESGRSLWRTPLDRSLASPLYWDSGWLFASTEDGELVTLNAQDGGIVWRIALESPLAVPPAPLGDRVFVALRNDRIVSLNQETGAVIWTYPLNQNITGLTALDDQLLVGTRANLLHSISLTRGRIRWSQKAGADVVGAPLADDDQIYFAALDNAIRALGKNSGNLKWNRHLPSRPAGGPLRVDNVVLLPLVTTDIAAFDATTGKDAFTIRAAGEHTQLGGLPFLREATRPTAPRLIAMSREGALRGFAARFEPPPAPIGELPGVVVKNGW